MAKSKEEIIQAARLMVERYGDSALHQVDLRIRELREHGEEEAANLWRDIREVVRGLSERGADPAKH